MIKILSLFFEFFFIRKSLQKAHSLIEYVEQSATKLKLNVYFVAAAAASGLFLFTALVVGVIDLGLQWEQTGGLRFSGLMLSTSIFAALALGIFLVSSFVLKAQEEKMERERAASKQQQKERQMDFDPEKIGQMIEASTGKILASVSQKIDETLQKFNQGQGHTQNQSQNQNRKQPADSPAPAYRPQEQQRGQVQNEQRSTHLHQQNAQHYSGQGRRTSTEKTSVPTPQPKTPDEFVGVSQTGQPIRTPEYH